MKRKKGIWTKLFVSDVTSQNWNVYISGWWANIELILYAARMFSYSRYPKKNSLRDPCSKEQLLKKTSVSDVTQGRTLTSTATILV